MISFSDAHSCDLPEYTINSGVAPTLIYEVPDKSSLLSLIIKSLRDYYP